MWRIAIGRTTPRPAARRDDERAELEAGQPAADDGRHHGRDHGRDRDEAERSVMVSISATPSTAATISQMIQIGMTAPEGKTGTPSYRQ